jgi:hypothetical protein
MLERAIRTNDVERLTQLARMVPSGLAGFHDQLLDAEILYPGFLYREADPKARDRLLAKLRAFDGIELARSSPDAKLANDVLTAVAWIGDAEVVRQLDAWRRTPPSWAAGLYIEPHAYAEEAGWTLQADGSRRDLYVGGAHAIVRAEQPASPLRVLASHDEPCRYCSHPLARLFELERARDLGFGLDRVVIPFCHHCSAGGCIYFRCDDAGIRWHEANAEEPAAQCEYNPWDEGTLVLGPPLPSPFHRHRVWGGDDPGHIGGVPGWIDDAHHPNCLDCSKPCLFVGQLQVASGGRFYAFVCDACGVVTSTYQQT